MAMAQTVGKAGKNFQRALQFVGRSFGIAILLWLFVMILTSTLQIITGIEFVTIEFRYFSHIAGGWIDVCTTYFEGTWAEFEFCYPWYDIKEFVYLTEELDVDVATFIVVGAIDLILSILHTLALVIGMITVWLINAFIIGEDSQGRLLNPISLVQLIKVIPIIKEVVAGVHGIDESLITNLDLFLTAIDNLFYSIANGFFTGVAGIWHNIAEGILGKRSG